MHKGFEATRIRSLNAKAMDKKIGARDFFQAMVNEGVVNPSLENNKYERHDVLMEDKLV